MGRSGEGEGEHDGGRDECDIKGGMVRQGTERRTGKGRGMTR
jgi:hypothetical protein